MASSRENDTIRSEDRIQGWKDVRKALVLTWQDQKAHLFTAWVHVPLGVMFLLVITWAVRQGIDRAPFRFPAPVIAMMFFLVLLLFLDRLSARFPGQKSIDPEQDSNGKGEEQERRRFVDPVMRLLAPPCDFCLRNMSVMFTPSFILIPARELIPKREIGLIAAWFTVTQILAFLFPVLYIWALRWLNSEANAMMKRFHQQRKPSTAATDQSRRGSQATIAGVDYEKGYGFSGGDKLGPIATGLSGLTAHVIAPVSHIHRVEADTYRQMVAAAMEQARQQGIPTWAGVDPTRTFVSDVSAFQHPRPRHRLPDYKLQHPSHKDEHSRPGSRQPRRARSLSPNGVPTAIPNAAASEGDQLSATVDGTIDPLTEYSRPAMIHASTVAADARVLLDTPGILLTDPFANCDGPTRVNSQRQSFADLAECETRRPSQVTFDKLPHPSDGKLALQAEMRRVEEAGVTRTGSDEAETPSGSDGEGDSDNDSTAVEWLSSWLADLITPTIYLLVFIVGLPLFFAADIALPLFLGINILTFIAAITIVPQKIRRFLHPILSCSVASVFIIWAFLAMKGVSLTQGLNQYYSVNAGYLELWSLQGYRGPVPGAGDVLFTTLDAGIVSLAVPMYRYRRELKENLAWMMVVLTPCAALSLFFWGWIAALMGMDQLRSLAFVARFMSTPLAIELAANVGADESITVILVVLTGILAAILKDHFFRWMQVDRKDYLLVGITMGSTAGAIGASSLINTPKVMAVASLSFVIFGSLLLVATAVPAVVEVVRSLA